MPYLFDTCFKKFITYFLLCAWWRYVHHSVCAEAENCRVSSRDWTQVASLTEPSCWPLCLMLFLSFHIEQDFLFCFVFCYSAYLDFGHWACASNTFTFLTPQQGKDIWSCLRPVLAHVEPCSPHWHALVCFRHSLFNICLGTQHIQFLCFLDFCWYKGAQFYSHGCRTGPALF